VKIKQSHLRRIIKEEIQRLYEKSKSYGGSSPDFQSWSEDRIKKYWNSMGGTWDKVLAKVKKAGFSDDPEAFVSTLHKKVKGKWPSEK